MGRQLGCLRSSGGYPSRMAVKLQKETSPLATIALLATVTTVTILVLYLGIPGTGFHGLRAGVHFDMEAGFEDARFMDNRLKASPTRRCARCRRPSRPSSRTTRSNA